MKYYTSPAVYFSRLECIIRENERRSFIYLQKFARIFTGQFSKIVKSIFFSLQIQIFRSFSNSKKNIRHIYFEISFFFFYSILLESIREYYAPSFL